jgi:hypothetical protein
MAIGVFQGRDLRLDLDPWADAASSFRRTSGSRRNNSGGNLEKLGGASKGAGRTNSQSGLW